ncbi:MAG: hypothetical protein Q8R60_13080 [Mycobacteriales bacterium]|nr:hypothetical protein [Mycobacteriales bacterium]
MARSPFGRRQAQPDLLEQLHSDSPPPHPGERVVRPPSERFKAGGLWLLGAFAAVVIAAVYADQGKPPFPPLETSCTTGALAIAPTTVGQRDEVRYTLVGPDGDVLLALNTTGVSATGVATPSAPGAVTQVFPEQPMLGCRSQDDFPAQVPVGRHTVTAFRLVNGTWTSFASTTLTVR